MHNVALLSRGYGRRTKGYREVKTDSHYRDVGDEPLQIKLKFPGTVVVVCEKRAEGSRESDGVGEHDHAQAKRYRYDEQDLVVECLGCPKSCTAPTISWSRSAQRRWPPSTGASCARC